MLVFSYFVNGIGMALLASNHCNTKFGFLYTINIGCASQWICGKSQGTRRNQDGDFTRSIWYIGIT